MQQIGGGAFNNINNLQLTISQNNSRFYLQNCLLIEMSTQKVISCIAGENVKECSIPQGVKSIADYAFFGCKSLQLINIPDDVESLGRMSFACLNIASIKLPANLKEIGEIAFWANRRRTDIHIPDNVQVIRDGAFSGIYNPKLSITNDHPYYYLKGGMLIEKANQKVISFVGGNSVDACKIPEEIREIGTDAFNGCSWLKAINIPHSVVSIGPAAFANCEILEAMDIPNGVTSIEPTLFFHCPALISVRIPEGVTNIGYYAFQNCISLRNLSIPDSVVSIHETAFEGVSAFFSLQGSSDSYVEKYAKEHNIPFWN